MVVFWAVLAILYLGLAAVSWRWSSRFDQKLEHAQEQFTDSHGDTTVGDEPGPEDSVVFRYWADLRVYLNQMTYINTAGFALAAVAAVVTYVTTR